MINDAVLCQDNAAKHILVSKQAETWSCATGGCFMLLLLELQLNHEYVLCGTG